jgi:hypothetical protein
VNGTSNLQRFILTAAGSEVEVAMARLARERALYRMMLGMPDQADLLNLLMSRNPDPVDVPRVIVNLMALRAEE